MISSKQLRALIILSAFGSAAPFLPRRVAELAGQGGWLFVIALTAAAAAGVFLITGLTRRFPREAFVSYMGRMLGKPPAYALAAALSVKLIISAGLELRVFGLLTKDVLLKNTPTPAVCAVFALLCAYAASKGAGARARGGGVLFAAAVPLFASFVLLALFNIDLSNLLPVRLEARALYAVPLAGSAFAGLECLPLVSPFIEKPASFRRSALSAVFISGGALALLTALLAAKFGPYGAAAQRWPLIAAADMLNIPGIIIEREGALIFSLWIITSFAGINMLLFYAALLLKTLLKGSGKIHAYACAAAAFALSAVPLDERTVERFMDMLYIIPGAFYIFALPLLLIVVSKLRGGEKNAA